MFGALLAAHYCIYWWQNVASLKALSNIYKPLMCAYPVKVEKNLIYTICHLMLKA